MGLMTWKEIQKVNFRSNTYDRFQNFLEISPLCSGKNYWRGLRDAYEDSDNLFAWREKVVLAFASEEPHKEFLMTKAERNYLAELPDTFDIYRGMTEEEFKSKEYNISWTLSYKQAIFFTTYLRNHDTNHMQKRVCKIKIKKSQVIAYWNGRKEHEIIYLHKKSLDKAMANDNGEIWNIDT